MKLDLNTSSLNWENANVYDYRYIHHLMLMIEERFVGIGLSPTGLSSSSNIPANISPTKINFNFANHSPNGILTWNQLASIYYSTLFLGTYVYLNEDNFNESNWQNFDNRKWINYSLKEMGEIGGINFFSNPFIPGQRLDYYNKFLYPLKKILSSFTKVWTNRFWVSDNVVGGWTTYQDLEVPYIEIDGSSYRLDGPDLISFYQDSSNFINKINGNTADELNEFGVLGYSFTVNYLYDYWTNYGTTDNEIFSGWIFSSFGYRYSNTYKCGAKFPPGLPYKVYLYHSSYPIMYDSSTYFITPSHHQTPWNLIIEVKSSTVPNNGEIVENISLPDMNFDLSLTKCTPAEFYRSKYILVDGDIESERNPNERKYFERVSCTYYPMIVVDFTSRFIYF